MRQTVSHSEETEQNHTELGSHFPDQQVTHFLIGDAPYSESAINSFLVRRFSSAMIQWICTFPIGNYTSPNWQLTPFLIRD